MPQHEDDYDWDACSEFFFQDHDVLWLYDSKFTGVEAPSHPLNQTLGIGDAQPLAWFEDFGNVPPRDPNCGFR
ncbi:hypothetical protein [Embleya sp. NPDC005971]|uniref:hypothetical protein n=1 Tax=Embleya sp. NPDC005971 TaxID=3156724 RepID=UPI0033DA5090